MMRRIFKNSKVLLSVGVILALMAVVACGTAAPAEPPKEPVDVPPANAPVDTPVPAPVEVPKEIIQNLSVTPTPVPQAPSEVVVAKVDRVIYGFGEVQETNRWWTVGRTAFYQYDPWAETLVDLEATTNNRIPRIAESWEMNQDASAWTFHLVEGVPFQGDYGEVTARDVKASTELHLEGDAGSGAASYFATALKEIEVVDDYTITYHMNGSTLLMPDMMSRGFGGGEVLIVSQQQLDEGFESIDEKPYGTGPYQYGGRSIGESIWFERIEGDHWRGERPDFKEIEIRWMREEATRLAALLAGEIHIASLSRELQFEAIKQGMKNISAQVPTNYLSLFLGGLYFSEGDPAYDPTIPWADKVRGPLIRQAMNKAVNRQEMTDFVLRGSGTPMYNTAFHPSLEGWNPQWVEDWEELYGFDPEAATDLMRQAGFGPENPMELTIWNYTSSDEPETAVMVEAMINYWEPIGIKVKIVDSEWGTVRGAYRAKDEMIKQGGWGNVITMRSLVDRVRSWQYPEGTSRYWETDLINENWAKISETTDTAVIDQLVREIGDERFYSFPDIPLFWFDLEVTVNPEVIESWTYPGTSASKTSHWNLLKAAQ